MAFCNTSRNNRNPKKASGMTSSSASSSNPGSMFRNRRNRAEDDGGDEGDGGGDPESEAAAASSAVACCLHKEVMKDLCVQCGQDIRKLTDEDRKTILQSASISMIHSIPELKISQESAEQLGRADEERLLRDRKLILLVDLDQTIIHTTNDPTTGDLLQEHPDECFHFSLDHSLPHHPHHPNNHAVPVYHTKTRPHCRQFLDSVSRLFELHIVTFGSRMYAHEIARFLDPDRKLFSHRILSRDECISAHSKTANLKELFPCGDSLVCIIDDREDVWNFASNVVPVKAYQFFSNTGDINSPFKAASEEDGTLFQQSATTTLAAASCNLQSAGPSDHLHALPSSPSSCTTTAPVDGPEETGNQPDTGIQETETGTSSTAGQDKKDKDINLKTKSVQEKCRQLQQRESSGSDHQSEAGGTTTTRLKETEAMVEGEEEETKVKEDKVKADTDTYLMQLQGILSRIHAAFYSEYDEKRRYRHESEPPIKVPDLKDIIPRIRKQVLHGCTIVFSGVVPNGVPVAGSRVHRLATSLGAKVGEAVVVPPPASSSPVLFAPQERTTHVVASKWGTVKVKAAQKDARIRIVNPLWLYACAENWERVSEDGYSLREGEDFQSHPLVVVEKKPAVPLSSSVTPSAAATHHHSFRSLPQQSSSSCPPLDKKSGSPVTGDDEDMLSEAGLMQHPLNQLSMFSSRELQCMDKEVEDACSEGDEDMFGGEDSSDDEDKSAPNVTCKRLRESSSEEEEEVMDGGECPKGWRRRSKKLSSSAAAAVVEDEDERTVDSDVAFGPAGGFLSSSSSSSSSAGRGGGDGSSSGSSLDGAADMLEREIERERERERERESVCVCHVSCLRERESVCVCLSSSLSSLVHRSSSHTNKYTVK